MYQAIQIISQYRRNTILIGHRHKMSKTAFNVLLLPVGTLNYSRINFLYVIDTNSKFSTLHEKYELFSATYDTSLYLCKHTHTNTYIYMTKENENNLNKCSSYINLNKINNQECNFKNPIKKSTLRWDQYFRNTKKEDYEEEKISI